MPYKKLKPWKTLIEEAVKAGTLDEDGDIVGENAPPLEKSVWNDFSGKVLKGEWDREGDFEVEEEEWFDPTWLTDPEVEDCRELFNEWKDKLGLSGFRDCASGTIRDDRHMKWFKPTEYYTNLKEKIYRHENGLADFEDLAIQARKKLHESITLNLDGYFKKPSRKQQLLKEFEERMNSYSRHENWDDLSEITILPSAQRCSKVNLEPFTIGETS